jgi:hypothetical protein
MMLDAISRFLLSPELDYFLTYAPMKLNVASRKLIVTATSCAAKSFAQKIFNEFLIECLHSALSSLLDQSGQLLPLVKL